jgi:dTDP-4-dehydrorhamnose reductase
VGFFIFNATILSMGNVINMKLKEKKTILIIGASSFIGSNFAEHFKHDYKVIGTYHRTPIDISGVLCLPCDVLSNDNVHKLIRSFRPDIVVYCAGVSSVTECSLNEASADALNTSGLFNVAEYCQRYRAQICYISSCFVFDGAEKNYLEMDIPEAATVYGRTQAAAEFYIQKTSLDYLIFRCSRLYGRGINPFRSTWFELLQSRLLCNENVVLDDSTKIGFLDVNYLAMIIRVCIENGVTNRLLQVSSSDVITHYDFGCLYADIFNQKEDNLSRGRWFLPSANVGKQFFKLDITNIEGYLNLQMPSVRESLELTHKILTGSLSNKELSS